MRAEGGKRENGWHEQGTTAYPHHRCEIHHGLPTHTTTGTYGSGGIQIVHDDDGCGFAGAGNSSSVRNLEVGKVGAVTVMVIIVVNRIKHSRCEEVYGGQFERAINKSKRNVKATSRQLEETV